MNRRWNRSVKEAFDHLPSGICFFDPNGIVTLCNYQMHRVCFALTGRDLQSLPELQAALRRYGEESGGAQAVVLLADGSAWQFAQAQITTREGNTYTQVTASDVTELYRRQKELEEDNRKLTDDAARIRRLSSDLLALIREEEILHMKMRVHDDIGRSVIATRQFLQQDKPTAQLDLTAWKNAVRLLRHENELTEAQDAAEALLRAARGIGIRIFTDGEFPGDTAAKAVLLAVIRECMTNAVRHAGADALYVRLTGGGHRVSVSVTNNGHLPDGEIVEGGGLTSLRILVEKSGGSMEVKAAPRFELTASLPVRREETT